MSNSPIVMWNERAVAMVQNIVDSDPERDRTWRSTGPAARVYALLNVAMHDAVAGIENSPPLKQRWITSVSTPDVPAQFSAFAALGAGFHLLDSLFEKQERKEDLARRRDELGRALPNFRDDDARRAALYGQEVAQALLDDPRWGKITENPRLDPPEDQRLPRDPERVGNFGWGRPARPTAGSLPSSWIAETATTPRHRRS